ncbi:MAG: thiamine diphosphokinase [Clostridiaceae bacterium]
MRRVIIVSGGRHPSLELFRSIHKTGDFIIGADSGAEFLRREGIVPDLLLGDFDSIKEETLLFFKEKTKILKYDAVKDFTDTEAAYEEAIKLDPDEIYFLGCTGSRLDHFIGNLSLLNRALKAGINGYLMDDHNKIFFMDKPGIIKKGFGNYISFQAFRESVKDFSLQGTRYPLTSYELKLGDPRNVSNEFLDEEIKVSFKSGVLMVFMTRD